MHLSISLALLLTQCLSICLSLLLTVRLALLLSIRLALVRCAVSLEPACAAFL